jgi:hypothetical protein
MTEYEITDAIVSYSTAAMSAMTLYLSAVTAYLVAAFMAATRLNRIQVIIVNVLFIFVSGFFTFGTVGYLTRQTYYVARLLEINPNQSTYLNYGVVSFIGIVEIMGIAASLYFMWSVRHPKEE